MRINRQLQLLALVTSTACLMSRFPNDATAASVKEAWITRVNNRSVFDYQVANVGGAVAFVVKF